MIDLATRFPVAAVWLGLFALASIAMGCLKYATSAALEAPSSAQAKERADNVLLGRDLALVEGVRR